MLAARNISRVSTPAARPNRAVVRVRCEFIEASTPKSDPLIERLGGPTGVRAAVDIFYKKVLADGRVNNYFKNTDMNKQRAHQAAFMTYAFGGENKYPGRDMVEAHKHLIPHLEDSHFDAIVEHFVATLNEMGVSQSDIDDACKIVESTREPIVHGY